MAGASNKEWCKPCGREGEDQRAHSWCSGCLEPLCEECLKFHRKGKTTENHKTTPILEIIGKKESMTGASTMKFCKPCGREGEDKRAHSWCNDCSEPLCKKCLKYHRKGKTTEKHKTIPYLNRFYSSVFEIPTKCHTHNYKKFSIYCIHHDQIGCASCLQDLHIECEEVISIKKASQSLTTPAIVDLQRRILDCSLIISKIIEVYQKNLSSISEQKNKYREKVSKVRKDLNTCLDELEQNVDRKLDDCDTICKDEIEKSIKDLATRKSKSESWHTAIEKLTENENDKSRIFAAIKTIDHLQVEEESFLSKFQEDLVAYELFSSPFDFIETIESMLATIANIKIEKIKTTVQQSSNTQQIDTYIQQGKIHLLHKISSSKLEMIAFGKACLTMDNRIVFVEYQLRVYDISSSSVHTIQLKSVWSSDITCDLKNNVYVSFPGDGIYNIDIMNLNEGYRINTKQGGYQQVKHKNGLLYTNWNDKIVLFNQQKTIVKTLECIFKPVFMCVENCDGIYISDGKSIIRMTETGSHNIIPTIMEMGEAITGLDVDGQGQLYACIYTDEVGTVVRINTTTGYREPVLENLVTPCYIAFHPTKNMFLVITDRGKECSVYLVTN